MRNAHRAGHVALQPQSEHLFAIDFRSNVRAMRNASAVAHAVAPPSERPRLTLVPDPAPRPPAPARQRLAALLAGLICGFVLAAAAAVAGGGSPAAALAVAGLLAAALAAVLVHARRVTVRNRRRARARHCEPAGATVISLDAARAA